MSRMATIKRKDEDTMEQGLRAFMNQFPANYNLYFDTPMSSENVGKGSERRYDTFLRIMSDPASRIYKGIKKFELRKYVPKHTGLVFLFETEKTQAITGCFYYEDFLVKPVSELWEIVGEKATKQERFDSYFEGKKYGVALEILDYLKFSKPISSIELYKKFPELPKPPQPYVYLYSSVESRLSNYLRPHALELIQRNSL
jgi:predicted transcriptional regulator